MSNDKIIYGPLFTNFKLKCQEAIAFLKERKEGIATEVIYHPQLGFIDLPYGRAPIGKQKGYGLAKLIAKHPEVLNNLQKIVESTRIQNYESAKNRYLLKSDKYEAIISVSWFEERHRWLLTAYEPPIKKSSSIVSILDIHKSNHLNDRGENDTATSSENDNSKDTTKNKPNQILNLGAYEIIKNNSDNLDYKGFIPTYKTLSNYDHLIDPAIGKTTSLTNDCTIPLTIKNILNIINKCSPQVRKLATHLKASTKEQSVFNVWHWIKTNIPYGIEDGEQLATPARTYADAKKGIKRDCDDYAIFASCLLKEMGYLNPPPHLEIVAFNNKDKYSHIYAKLDGIILDGVMSEFNVKPPNVTKSMELSILEGIENQDFSGLGEVQNSLIAKGKILAAKVKNRTASATERKDLNKILYLMAHEDVETKTALLGIMKHVDDVSNGKVVFKSNRINTLLSGLANISLGSLDYYDSSTIGSTPILYDMTDDELEALDDIAGVLGKIKLKNPIKNVVKNIVKTVTVPLKTAVDVVKTTVVKPTQNIIKTNVAVVKDLAKGNVKEALKDVKAGVKTAVTDTKSGIKVAVKDVGEGVKAVVAVVKATDPGLLTMRSAIETVMIFNIFNLAKITSVALGTEAEAIKLGFTSAEYKEHVSTFSKVKKLFENIGGDPNNLIEAVKKGKGKKAFLPIGKGKLKGLGDVGIPETAAAEASGFIATVVAWYKKLVKAGAPSLQTVIDKAKNVIDKKNNNNNPTDPGTDPGAGGDGEKSNTTTYVLIGLGILGVSYFAFK